MNTGVMGLSWNQVIGMVCGGGGVFAAAWAFFWNRERGRKKRKERPPQEEKILRPAGYSAMLRVDELAEKSLWALMEAMEEEWCPD